MNRPARAGDQCLADLLDGGQIRPRMVNWRDGPGRDCWRLELLIEAGQFYEVPPGHDSWVVSDEPWITIDWQPITAFAGTEGGGFDRVLATLLVTDIVDSTARARWPCSTALSAPSMPLRRSAGWRPASAP